MSRTFDYRDYPKRPSIDDYNEYQRRYAEEPRYSDRVMLDLIAEAIGNRPEQGVRLLDIGCSTGNLLGHIKNRFPGLRLSGGDLAASSIEACRLNPRLKDLDLVVLDVLEMKGESEFDVAITNAVTCYFDWDQYDRAVRNISFALERNGTYIAFEWFHPFVHQDIQIFETTVFHPEGLRLCFRPYPKVEAILRKYGFTEVRFIPFELPIELPMPGHDTEVVTYTVNAADGHNLCFRGTLYQPWCHLVARKAG